MFREMRRKKQELSMQESIEILRRGSSGVLALIGDDNYSYALPISYVYDDSKIYFHCAKEGHKIDAVKKCNKASFCVVDMDNVVPEKFTTCFRSVIAFGTIHIMEEDENKRRAIEILAKKYTPDNEQARTAEIDSAYQRLCMLELNIEHMTGKEAIELVKDRSEK